MTPVGVVAVGTGIAAFTYHRRCYNGYTQWDQRRKPMSWQDRISIDPKVLVGKPVIKGTRIAVEFLMELLANGWTHEQIRKNYPHLTRDDIQAALHYAAETLKQEHVYAMPV